MVILSVKVIKKSEAEVKTILGGSITIYCTPETVDSKKLVFVLGSFAPGEGLDPHIHPESEEIYYIIEGTGTVYTGKEKKEISIEPGMALYIPDGIEHSVRNTGSDRLVIGFSLSPGTEPTKETET